MALTNSVNSYTGGTNILAGTLQIQSATPGRLVRDAISSGGTLDLYGLSPSLANLSGGGVVTNSRPSTTSTLSTAYIGGAGNIPPPSRTVPGGLRRAFPMAGRSPSATRPMPSPGGSSVSGGTLAISADSNLGGVNSGVALNNGVLQFQGNTNFTLGGGRESPWPQFLNRRGTGPGGDDRRRG